MDHPKVGSKSKSAVNAESLAWCTTTPWYMLKLLQNMSVT